MNDSDDVNSDGYGQSCEACGDLLPPDAQEDHAAASAREPGRKGEWAPICADCYRLAKEIGLAP